MWWNVAESWQDPDRPLLMAPHESGDRVDGSRSGELPPVGAPVSDKRGRGGRDAHPADCNAGDEKPEAARGALEAEDPVRRPGSIPSATQDANETFGSADPVDAFVVPPPGALL